MMSWSLGSLFVVTSVLIQSRLISGVKESIDLSAGIPRPADDIISVQRRIWNDEVQPCIEKYCYHFISTDTYGSCMRRYCRRSIRLAASTKPSGGIVGSSVGTGIQRLAALSSSPAAVVGGDSERTQLLPLAGSTIWMSLCRSSVCQDSFDLDECVTLKCLYKPYSERELTILRNYSTRMVVNDKMNVYE